MVGELKMRIPSFRIDANFVHVLRAYQSSCGEAYGMSIPLIRLSAVPVPAHPHALAARTSMGRSLEHCDRKMQGAPPVKRRKILDRNASRNSTRKICQM